jgi:hypothetical protein
MIPVLLVMALLSLGYAIYRSTTEQVTLVEGNRQTVYGDPMHGLMLGLCIFAGLCVLGAALLLLDRNDRDSVPGKVTREERETLSRRTLS